MTDKSELSLDNRAFLACAEISAHLDNDSVDSDIIMAAVRKWSTDDIPEGSEDLKDYAGDDALDLGNLIISHLTVHSQILRTMEATREFSQKIARSDLDGEKLANQDPEEWDKLRSVLTGDSFSEEDVDIPDDFTVDDILATESAVEGELTPDERRRSRVLSNIEGQAETGLILAKYLHACVHGDRRMAHEIIDDMGCVLTHALTTLILSWVRGRTAIPEDFSMEDWVDHLVHTPEEILGMSDDEKIEFAQHMEEQFGEDEDD